MWLKHRNDHETAARKKELYFAGNIGIICNFVLFAIKLTIGIVTGSLAVMADGFNNLSDTAASLITIIGAKLSELPADKEHPYGHGRLEYISALMVSFFVLLVGFQLGIAAIDKIRHPETVTFDMISFTLVLISIFAKIALSRFNLKVGARIDSDALKAAGADSLGDVLISSTVLLAFTLNPILPFSIDGFAGLLVAVFILFMGYQLVKETISPLLGEAPDPQLVQNIHSKLRTYPYVVGTHDLYFHNYGIGRMMATVHVDISGSNDLLLVHDLMDQAERDVLKELGVHLLIHKDPVSSLSEKDNEIKVYLENLIEQHPVLLSVHDFRTFEDSGKKMVIFDLEVAASKLEKGMDEEQIRLEVEEQLANSFPSKEWVIRVERHYD